MNIPQKFTFFNGNSLLKLTNIQGTYYCTLPHIEADTLSSAVYDRMNVEHKLHTGKWKIVADLSVDYLKLPMTVNIEMDGEQVEYNLSQSPNNPDRVVMVSKFGSADNPKSFVVQCIKNGTWVVQEEIKKEPEMKFPFTFTVKDSDTAIVYTARGLNDEGRIQIVWEDDLEGTDYNLGIVKEFIKKGDWIVQSVGEQEPKEEIVEPVPEYRVEDDPVTADKISVSNLSTISVKLEIANLEESFAKLTSYREKVEVTIKAVEKLSELLESLGIGSSTKDSVVETSATALDLDYETYTQYMKRVLRDSPTYYYY